MWMAKYLPELKFLEKVKVKLEFSNYATKTDLNRNWYSIFCSKGDLIDLISNLVDVI